MEKGLSIFCKSHEYPIPKIQNKRRDAREKKGERKSKETSPRVTGKHAKDCYNQHTNSYDIAVPNSKWVRKSQKVQTHNSQTSKEWPNICRFMLVELCSATFLFHIFTDHEGIKFWEEGQPSWHNLQFLKWRSWLRYPSLKLKIKKIKNFSREGKRSVWCFVAFELWKSCTPPATLTLPFLMHVRPSSKLEMVHKLWLSNDINGLKVSHKSGA